MLAGIKRVLCVCPPISLKGSNRSTIFSYDVVGPNIRCHFFFCIVCSYMLLHFKNNNNGKTITKKNSLKLL